MQNIYYLHICGKPLFFIARAIVRANIYFYLGYLFYKNAFYRQNVKQRIAMVRFKNNLNPAFLFLNWTAMKQRGIDYTILGHNIDLFFKLGANTNNKLKQI